MPKQLKETWVPDEKYFWGNNANKHAMTNYGESRSWCEHQLPDFKMYFCKSRGGCGKTKANWDLTFWNWVKRNWQNRKATDPLPSKPKPATHILHQAKKAIQKATKSKEERNAQADKWLSQLK